MRFLPLMLIFVFSVAHAQSTSKGMKWDIPKGKHFPGEQIQIFSPEGKMDAAGEVTTCTNTKCQLKITKIRKNAQLSKNHTIKSVSAATAQTKATNDLYFSLGGPFIYGYQLGYQRSNWSIAAGMVDKEIKDVNLKGKYFSVMYEKLFDAKVFVPFEYGFYLQGGYISAEMDFSKFNGNIESEGAFFMGAGGTIRKNWQKFFIFGRLGYSYNLLTSSFKNVFDQSINTPFAGGIYATELGLGWRF